MVLQDVWPQMNPSSMWHAPDEVWLGNCIPSLLLVTKMANSTEHLALGLFFKGDNLEGKLSSEELPEFFLHFICMKGDILKKGLLGRFEVAFGWWDLSDWCCCVRRTKVSLTVRPS